MNNNFPFAFIRGKFCRSEKALVPIQCKAVQYGIGFYTGMRAHFDPTTKNLYIFRLKDHYKRLKNASKITGMQFKLSYQQFEDLIKDIIKKNKAKEDVYIRPTIYSPSIDLTPRFTNPGDDIAVYMISLKNYFSQNKGLSVGISSWCRVDHDMIAIDAKTTGSYVNGAFAKTEILKKGYDEAILLNRNGNICEATGANIFAVRDGKIITPPLSSNNLNGITRASIIEVIKNELGQDVIEKDMTKEELLKMDELILCGTAAKVAWIKKVDGKNIGSGKQGPISKTLQVLIDQVSRNKLPAYKKWLTAVY